MRRIQYILVLILVVFLGTIKLFPQSNSGIDQYPEIGKPIPNFKLKNIQGHTTKSVSSEELTGKPYILYFWSKYCKSAVTGIFKVDSLYKEFGKDVNLFLIGGQVNDDGKEYYYSEGMEPGKKNYFALYKALKENGNLNLPVLYDPELFHRFLPGEGVPHIIYVDKNGIIQAITYAIDHEKIAALIQGKKFFFHDRSAIGKKIEAENKYSRSVPYLIDKNGGNSKNFMFRSVLSRYSLEMPKIPAIVPKVSLACEDNYLESKGRLEGKTSLKDLYRLAYLGYSYAPGFYYKDYGYKKDFSQIILELENDSIFKNVNYEKRNNLYVYSLIVPHYKATPEYLMQVMQNDLSSYFGYKARIEERQMPYWSITADTNIVRQYKTKNTKFGGRGTLITDGGTKLGCRNKTIDNYLASILSSVSYDIDIPIINECQVNWRIDIPLTDVFLFDFNEIKSVLKKQGFIVEKRTKAFNVLVISD